MTAGGRKHRSTKDGTVDKPQTARASRTVCVSPTGSEKEGCIGNELDCRARDGKNQAQGRLKARGFKGQLKCVG